MNLDVLITILVILSFLLGPLLKRSQGPQQKRTSRSPSRPSDRSAGTGAGRSDESGQQPEGSLAERLEEARRRVIEAIGETKETVERAPEGRAPAPPVLDWQAAPREVPSFITQRERQASSRSSNDRRPNEQALRDRRPREDARTAKLAGERRLVLDDKAIVQGMIWHEILSEPASRRGVGFRRQTSRLRSP